MYVLCISIYVCMYVGIKRLVEEQKGHCFRLKDLLHLATSHMPSESERCPWQWRFRRPLLVPEEEICGNSLKKL